MKTRLLECPGCGGKVSGNTDFCSQCGSLIEKESKSILIRVLAAIVLIPIAVVFIASMDVVNIMTFLSQDQTEQHQNKAVPILGHKERSIVIKKMREDEAVVDAAINQEGDALSLLLIVPPGTSTSQAEALGERFVWSLKSNIANASEPGKEKEYSYLIGVYTPDQKRIAIASMPQNETSLRW